VLRSVATSESLSAPAPARRKGVTKNGKPPEPRVLPAPRADSSRGILSPRYLQVRAKRPGRRPSSLSPHGDRRFRASCRAGLLPSTARAQRRRRPRPTDPHRGARREAFARDVLRYLINDGRAGHAVRASDGAPTPARLRDGAGPEPSPLLAAARDPTGRTPSSAASSATRDSASTTWRR